MLRLYTVSQQKLIQTLDENPKSLINGLNNGILDDKPNDFKYNFAPCEVVLPSPQPKTNAYIVFGRDKFGDWSSGYGGAGESKAAAIDIVVGRTSALDAERLNAEDKLVNSSVGADAARIYLSQKADIDKYFGVVDGRTANASIATSAIAIKADDVRLIARNTLKIVTGTDTMLSNQNSVPPLTGIQLIGNNDDKDLQPIPKGNNLVLALEDIILQISKLAGIVNGFMQIQRSFNDQIQNHVHVSPFLAEECSWSPTLFTPGVNTRTKMMAIIEQGLKFTKYNLTKTKLSLSAGDKAINSAYNYTN